MRIQATIFAGTLLLLATGVRASAEEVAPERARALLIAGHRVSEPRGMEFEEDGLFHTNGREPQELVRRWRFRGDPNVDAIACGERDVGRDELGALTIRKDGAVYRLVTGHSGWNSCTGPVDGRVFHVLSVLQIYLRPFNTVPFREALQKHPILEAHSEEGRLTVVFAHSEKVARTLRKSLDISGPGLWRAEFTAFDGAYVPARLEQLTTKRVREYEKATNTARWVDNDDILEPDADPVMVLGQPFHVSVRTSFADYLKVGDAVLPTRVERRNAHARIRGEIVPHSIRIGELRDDAFAFAAPAEFGPRGIHTDLHRRESVQHGEFFDTPDAAVEYSVRALDKTVRGDRGDGGGNRWTLSAWIAIVSVLTGGALWWRGRSASHG